MDGWLLTDGWLRALATWTGPSAWGVAAAGLAALAVLLGWLPSPAARVMAPDRRAVPRLLRGRGDAAPLGRRLLWGALAGAALAVVLLRAGALAGLAGSLLATAAVTVGLGWLEPGEVRLRRRQRIADAPQALDLLASCLQAGLPVRTALRAVVEVTDGPLSDDLRQVLRLVELGHDDASAWRTLAGHEQLGAAALDLARSVEGGTLLVEGLLVHAELARADRRGQVEAAARRVGVRSVLPLMTCFIPAFLLLGIVPTVASAVMNALSY
jgi:pilus assembly protein TadC